MIRIFRGPEPDRLRPIRAAQLEFLRALGRDPTSNEIEGYRAIADELWKAQRFKCCYCEHKIKRGFNDVEHYRPKTSANRLPGCTNKHGYWWLAFTWDNLLFACPSCNRSAKNDRFPLDDGAASLVAEAAAPGDERPLLLDPGSTINPVEHIQFVRKSVGLGSLRRDWWAAPRNESKLGLFTIEVCDLNNIELRELRNDYYEHTIFGKVKALTDAIASGDTHAVHREHNRALELLQPSVPYVAFSYDVLRASVEESQLHALIQIGWPTPDQVGM